MANPTLGGLTLECPARSSIEPLVKLVWVDVTGGETKEKNFGRRYKYKLEWDFLENDDYNDLQALFDNFEVATFTWDKYPQCTSGIEVVVSLVGKEPKTPGIESSGYYSGVTLILEETTHK